MNAPTLTATDAPARSILLDDVSETMREAVRDYIAHMNGESLDHICMALASSIRAAREEGRKAGEAAGAAAAIAAADAEAATTIPIPDLVLADPSDYLSEIDARLDQVAAITSLMGAHDRDEASPFAASRAAVAVQHLLNEATAIANKAILRR